MYKVLLPLVIGMGWLILVTALLGFLPTRVPAPDVALIVVIIFGFRYPLPLGGGLSFLLGLLQDVLAGGIIGLNALSKTVVFSLTRSIARRFYFPNVVSKTAMVALGGIVDNLLVITILLFEGNIHIPIPIFLRYLLVQILCTGLLAPVVFIVTPKISPLREKGGDDVFHYGHRKARAGRI